MYTYFHRALEYLLNPNSIIIVIGTMGNVIAIDNFIKDYKCTKILNNLEESEYIKTDNFNYTFYEPATEALPKIEKLIKKLF